MSAIDGVYGDKLRVHMDGVKYRGLKGLETLGAGLRPDMLLCAYAQLDTPNPASARTYKIGGETAHIWFKPDMNSEDRRRARIGNRRRAFVSW